jgi:hypothetical protein
MVALLRTISKAKWYTTEWVPEGDVSSDALTDLRTTSNELWVWVVEDSAANLNTVIVALASDRQSLSKLDYALLDKAELRMLEIRWKQSEGETPHEAANKAWHRDLTQLTASKVALLAASMQPVDQRPHTRVPEKEIREMLVAALQSGALNRARMQPSLLRELERHVV